VTASTLTRLRGLLLAGGAALAAPLFAPAAAKAAEPACTTAAFPHDRTVKVTSAELVAGAAGTPPSCRVKATASPVAGSRIGFEVWLPTSGWNGKLQMYGNGGYSSAIPAAAMQKGLQAGYAVVGTDTGHTGDDPDFARGAPEAIVDWGHRAVHVSVVQAKRMVTAFYKAAPRYSYFDGCSTGGQQAFMEAQRYPADFDGIIAGHPGSNRTHLNAGFLWLFLANHPTGENDKPIIPASKLAMISRAAVAQCRSANGSEGVGGHASDAYLVDPLSCRFDPQVLRCQAGDKADCLTDPQLAALRRMYQGARNPRTGEQIYFGWPVGSEATWSTYWADGRNPTQPMRVNFWRIWAFTDSWDWWKFDFDKDMARVDAKLAPVVNAMDPNLEAFRRRGGKLIQYHGLADSTVPAAESISYFDRVMARYGEDETRVGDFYRLFLAPGMAHCGGGPGPNAIALTGALENWVERGVAPAQLIATHVPRRDEPAAPPMSRPLCPYPAIARYRGGPANEAASFVCAAGQRRTDLVMPAKTYLK